MVPLRRNCQGNQLKLQKYVDIDRSFSSYGDLSIADVFFGFLALLTAFLKGYTKVSPYDYFPVRWVKKYGIFHDASHV